MFYKYEIRKKGDKRVLYIYMSSLYEEANEFKKQENTSIEEKVKNFIKRNNIDYNEGEVCIVSNGIIIKSININNKQVNILELIGMDNYNNKNFIVKVEKNNILNIMSLEDFLTSMLLTNISLDISDEVLKCLTILYRSYAYKKMGEKGYIKEDDLFINYKPLSYYKVLFFNNYNDIKQKLKIIIDQTDCMFMTYNNIFIEPFIHLVNNGHTAEDDNYNYLTKVSSLWDLLSPLYFNKKIYKIEDVMNLLNVSKQDIYNIKITKLNDNGCIKMIKVGNKEYKGEQFIKMLNLYSTDMTIIINNSYIYFINRGIGNNLGLSIEGSKYLASIGCNYLQILNYYFPKCQIKKYSN